MFILARRKLKSQDVIDKIESTKPQMREYKVFLAMETFTVYAASFYQQENGSLLFQDDEGKTTGLFLKWDGFILEM